MNTRLRLLLATLSLSLSLNAHAQAPAATTTAAPLASPATPTVAALPVPEINAAAWIVMDAASGQVLAAKDPDVRREPASLTKVMTTYLVAAALRDKTLAPTQTVTISERAWRTYGSRSFLQVGTQIDVDTLLKGMIVQSGNDAAVALAEAASGSEDAFALRMNQTAQTLGLKDSYYLNASGFFDNAEPRHFTTPRDMANLARALIRDFPEVHAVHALKEFSHGKIRQQNRNRLLWLDPSVDGLKTGHSDNAGYCLTATAQRNGQRIITVVMGTANDNARTTETRKLIDWAYQAFDPLRLYQAGQTVVALNVYKGSKDTVATGFINDLTLPFSKVRNGNPTVRFVRDATVIAPIAKGQRLGTLTVLQGEQRVGDFPVVALEDIPAAGTIGRGIDSVRLWFE
jgi:serine-type D-Ala-D-Ala carboxypeptidase (penicillin-binding protein 5/6)